MSNGTKGGIKKCEKSNINKGDCAEDHVKKYYKSQGYEPLNTDSLKNGSGNGIDHAFVNEKTGHLIFVETKNKSARLSKLQKAGGKRYVRGRMKEMWRGFLNGRGRWAAYDHKTGRSRIRGVSKEKRTSFIDALMELKKARKKYRKNTSYGMCRVWIQPDPTGCYNQASPDGSKPNTGPCKLVKRRGGKDNPDCGLPWCKRT